MQRAKELRLQCDSVKASIDELRRHKDGLVACFADVASGVCTDSQLQQLQQLARDAADSECMRGVDISEPQQNYAAKFLLAAISDMREAMPASLSQAEGT